MLPTGWAAFLYLYNLRWTRRQQSFLLTPSHKSHKLFSSHLITTRNKN
jgi:hypothetical protein